jgi:choline transporter-like protein 2/4/5
MRTVGRRGKFKIVVVGLCAALSYIIFSGKLLNAIQDVSELKDVSAEIEIPTLNFPLLPTVLITLAAYLSSSCFFSVYEMAIDTLFLCFLQDSEINDGSKEKPFYMSKKLMKILGKKNVCDEEKK